MVFSCKYLSVSNSSVCSACTQQLMTLAYETLEEATSSSQECAVQLFFAARNMFELFCSVYPTAHQKALTLFPQMSGRQNETMSHHFTLCFRHRQIKIRL